MGTLSVDKILKTSTGAAEFTLPATDGTAGQVWQTDGAGQISVAALAADTVTATQIAANAVTTTEIIDNAVTGAKIAMGSDATGDLLYYNGTDYVRLPAGTSSQVLTSAGAAAPTWSASAGGGKVLQVIHVTDAGPGDTTSSSTYVNTSTTGSITCSATTSKVFVMINGSSTGYRASDANQYNAAVCLYETVTSTRYPGGASDWGFGRSVIHITAHADNRFGTVMSGFWLHSPNSTSALTYTVQQRNPGLTSVYWNETASETATMTLMEIGA